MNKLNRLIACTVLVAAPVLVFAQGNSNQMSRGGMMNQQQMEQMNQNMAKMQSMMQEMRHAESDAERRRIREKHMESMQNHMGMMRGGMMRDNQGMMGNQGQGMRGNQGQGMMGNQSQGNRRDDAGLDNEQRLQMMENRMNQMQLMMEQMLEHQQQLNPN